MILLDTNIVSQLMKPQPDRLTLVTRNIRDFEKIQNLSLISPWELL